MFLFIPYCSNSFWVRIQIYSLGFPYLILFFRLIQVILCHIPYHFFLDSIVFRIQTFLSSTVYKSCKMSPWNQSSFSLDSLHLRSLILRITLLIVIIIFCRLRRLPHHPHTFSSPFPFHSDRFRPILTTQIYSRTFRFFQVSIGFIGFIFYSLGLHFINLRLF